MSPPTERMLKIQSMLEKTPDDAFLLYGLAMEYKKTGNALRAVEQFDRVIAVDRGYCYAYYQKGLCLQSTGDAAGARRTFVQGMDAATAKGDQHAREEIAAALEAME